MLEFIRNWIHENNKTAGLKLFYNEVRGKVYIGYWAYPDGKRVRRLTGTSIGLDATQKEARKVLEETAKNLRSLAKNPKVLQAAMSGRKAKTTVRSSSLGDGGDFGILYRLRAWTRSFGDRSKSVGIAGCLTKHVEGFLPWSTNPHLASVTAPECERFMEYLCGLVKPDKKTLQPKSVQTYVSMLKAFFNYSRKHGHITSSPALDLHYMAPQKEIKFFTSEEVALLAKTPVSAAFRDSAQAFLFACATGVRRVDIRLFTFGQLGKVVDGRYYPNPVTTFMQHKTSLRGRVVLNETSRAILVGQWEQLAATEPSERLSLPVFQIPGDTLVAKLFKAWLVKAKIPVDGRSWSKARHTCATQLNAKGADLRDIMLVLGHSSPTYTASRYSAPDDDRLIERVGRLVG